MSIPTTKYRLEELNYRCTALRRPCLRSCMSSIRKPAFRCPMRTYQFIHSTLIKIPFESLWTCLLTSNYLAKGWTGNTPKKHQTELHTSGWYHAWYPSSKNWDSFVFPQQTLQKTRCHADCYSSSSWLKQIAPVGRSNHRVTHGTLVHYDLGIRGIRVKHPWVKLMGDVFWCQKGPHDSLGMCFKR